MSWNPPRCVKATPSNGGDSSSTRDAVLNPFLLSKVFQATLARELCKALPSLAGLQVSWATKHSCLLVESRHGYTRAVCVSRTRLGGWRRTVCGVVLWLWANERTSEMLGRASKDYSVSPIDLASRVQSETLLENFQRNSNWGTK